MATAGESEAAGARGGAGDSIVTEYSTYEDFLDSQITPTDLYYLEVQIAVIPIGAHHIGAPIGFYRQICWVGAGEKCYPYECRT